MSVTPSITATAYVALGGAIGSVLRYQAGRMMTLLLGPAAVTAFPWATLVVNVVGSLAMGLLAGWLDRHGPGGDAWRLFIGVGLLGGFTTFSAFSFELFALVNRGQPALALTYALISITAGLTALYIGFIVMRVSA